MTKQAELLSQKIKEIVDVDLSEEEIKKIKQAVENNLKNEAKDELKTEALRNEAKDELKTKNAEVENAKKEVEKKNKELEAKNKTTEQPKQGNGARYTATAGMGLATGLGVFIALERIVRLEMLVTIGIAVASAFVASGITYAVLPSTQVDGAEAQEVNNNGKGK